MTFSKKEKAEIYENYSNMSKEEVCKELNRIIDESTMKAYYLLDANNMHLGDNLTALSQYKAPDDGETAMPLSSMYMFIRFNILRQLWAKRCRREESPCTLKWLHTDQEVQDEYNRQEALKKEIYSSDEYKLYLSLDKKYADIESKFRTVKELKSIEFES